MQMPVGVGDPSRCLSTARREGLGAPSCLALGAARLASRKFESVLGSMACPGTSMNLPAAPTYHRPRLASHAQHMLPLHSCLDSQPSSSQHCQQDNHRTTSPPCWSSRP